MPRQPEEYVIPSDWTNDDIIEWFNVTLAEPGVRCLELERRKGKLIVRAIFR